MCGEYLGLDVSGEGLGLAFCGERPSVNRVW